MNSNDIIYKDVVGFEGLYKVSNMGEVYSYDRWIVDSVGHKYFLKGKHLKKHLTTTGYYFVNLSKNSCVKRCMIHHLVLASFVGDKPFPKAETRHLNSIPTDNRLSNLCWGTKSENMQDAVKLGSLVFSRSKLTPTDITNICQAQGTLKEIAKRFNTNIGTVQSIKTKKSFKNFSNSIVYTRHIMKQIDTDILNFIRDRTHTRIECMKKFNLSLQQIKRIRKGCDTIRIKV